MSLPVILNVIHAPPPEGARNASMRDTLRVLLKYADYAEDDGTNSYPSLTTVAEELGMHKRVVRNCRDALVAQRRLIQTADAVPTKRGITYSVALLPPASCGESPHHQSCGESPHQDLGSDGRANGRGDGRADGRGDRAGNPRTNPVEPPEPVEPPDPMNSPGATRPGVGPRTRWVDVIQRALAHADLRALKPGEATGVARLFKRVELDHSPEDSRQALIAFVVEFSFGGRIADALELATGLGGMEHHDTRGEWLPDVWCPFVWDDDLAATISDAIESAAISARVCDAELEAYLAQDAPPHNDGDGTADESDEPPVAPGHIHEPGSREVVVVEHGDGSSTVTSNSTAEQKALARRRTEIEFAMRQTDDPAEQEHLAVAKADIEAALAIGPIAPQPITAPPEPTSEPVPDPADREAELRAAVAKAEAHLAKNPAPAYARVFTRIRDEALADLAALAAADTDQSPDTSRKEAI